MENPQFPLPLEFHMLMVIAIVLVALVLLSSKGGIRSTATQEQDEIALPKKLINTVPSKLPLKFKVKNLDSKNWVHDLEVEVKNTSEKPIYFLDFYIMLPEITGDSGKKITFWLHYGRGELLDFSTPLEASDVPINPGETYTFKIPEGTAKGWDYLRQKKGKQEPTQIVILFQGLNYGDGTGFSDSSGTPTNIHRKINLNERCLPPPKTVPSSLQSVLVLPATFSMPVNFFWHRIEPPSLSISSLDTWAYDVFLRRN